MNLLRVNDVLVGPGKIAVVTALQPAGMNHPFSEIEIFTYKTPQLCGRVRLPQQDILRQLANGRLVRRNMAPPDWVSQKLATINDLPVNLPQSYAITLARMMQGVVNAAAPAVNAAAVVPLGRHDSEESAMDWFDASSQTAGRKSRSKRNKKKRKATVKRTR